MAATGFTPIQLYYSTTASAAPSSGNLANGELALNITDGRLFYKDNGGVVQVLATKGAGTIGGSTTQVQYNNAGALAGSANLTFDGTTLTANALTVSNAVTLSGGTANGVAYLNGSKVLTTGSALTFNGTSFGVPNIDLNNGGILNLYSTGFGSYFQLTNNANALTFGYNGSEVARMTSAGLAVKTSSLLASLTVNGGTTIANLGDWNSKSNSMFELANPAVRFGIGYDSSDQVLLQAFDSSNNARLLCLQGYGGNVGIGSNSVPAVGSTVVLGVGGANGGTLAVLQSGSIVYRTSASTSGVDFYNPNASPMQWYTSGTGVLTLSAVGRLTSTANNTDNLLTLTSSAGAFSSRIDMLSSAGGGSVINASQYLGFLTGGSEAGRFDNNRNLLVGTTSAIGPARIAASQNTNGWSAIACNHTLGAGQRLISFANAANDAIIGTITNSGNIAVLYNTTSDHRLKKVIGFVTDSGSRIDALEPIEYEWKVNGERTRGFLAHKFQEVYAGSVTGTKDAVDTQGKPVYQSMQAGSSEVIADLVAEIQSLRKRLAAAGIA